MSDEFKEGIEDLPDDVLSPELRGQVIDLQEPTRNLLWIGAGSITVILIFFVSWSTLFLTRNEAEILEEKLGSQSAVGMMVREARKPIESYPIKPMDLREAISLAIDAATTELRVSNQPRSPYIAERGEAMILALEGLLRFSLEGGITEDDPDSKIFFTDELNRLGALRLEYYNNGILEQQPLLTTARLRQLIYSEEGRSRVTNALELEDLRSELKDAMKEESFSVAGAANTLGKWYRYYNQVEQTERCFKITMRYVKGYVRGSIYYKGHLPNSLSSLWDAYVESMEGLAQSAFEGRRFREARALFTSIYHTPEGAQNLLKRHQALGTSNSSLPLLNTLKTDIAALRMAAASPRKLPSFPRFSENDQTTDWIKFLHLLSRAPELSIDSVPRVLWDRLPDSLCSAIQSEGTSLELTTSLKKDILKTLNTLVEDLQFATTVRIDPDTLTARGQGYLHQRSLKVLSKEESAFLNRDIIEAQMAEVFSSLYQLSDGTRLSNQLDAKQIETIVTLYLKASETPQLHSSQASPFTEKIRLIRTGQYKPTVQELSAEIGRQKTAYKAWNKEVLQSEVDVQDKLVALHNEMRSLEKKESIEVGQIRQVQEQEDALYRQLADLKTMRKQVLTGISDLQAATGILSYPLRKQIAKSETQLLALEDQNAELRRTQLEDDHSILAQVRNQITLRQKYLSLLRQLKKTQGARELQRLQIERQRLETEVELLRGQAAVSEGNEREIVEYELGELEDQLHILVREFDSLFEPLRAIVNSISDQEQEIWKAENLLRKTRDEILELIGTADFPGSLEEKTARRAELLLVSSDDILNNAIYGSEMSRLNEEIGEDHARLHLLLQTESLARKTLQTFYPHIAATHPLIHGNGSLSHLQSYLDEQESLIAKYNALRRQNELVEDIYSQERTILANLEHISDSLGRTRELREDQTRNLTRYMENIIQSRNRLREQQQLLQVMQRQGFEREPGEEVAGTGYLLDNVDMFQMEHQIGLRLNEYRQSFEQRHQLIQEIQAVMEEKSQLDQSKLGAIRRRDQTLIDELIPKVAEKEHLLSLLTKKELGINAKLRQLAVNYSQSLEKIQAYRREVMPQMGDIKVRLTQLGRSIADNDVQLDSLTQKIFQTAGNVTQTITSISIDKLSGLDEIIAHQERELDRLGHIKKLKDREDYVKARALFLIGMSFYEESQLKKVSALASSHLIDHELWLEIERDHRPIVPEFNEEWIYSDEMLGSVQDQDQDQALFESWVDFLEQSALRIFQKALPQFVFSQEDNEINYQASQSEEQRDLISYIARSRFLSGEIHMKRAMRLIRSSRLLPQENRQARKDLEMAMTAFLSYLDFAEPLIYTSEEKAQGIDAERFGSQEFPRRSRRELNQVDEARIFIGVIASLKGSYQEAIAHYRDLLQRLSLRYNIPNQEVAREGEGGAKRVDPVLLEDSEDFLSPRLHPLFASLLAINPTTHEVLYRLGWNYQALADEENKKARANSILPVSQQTDFREKETSYVRRAITYHSQLIQTQSYSPYRRAALLQRALLHKRLGNYTQARQDLVAILGSPTDAGGSWSYQNLNPKGDLPGELNPGYAYVTFEIGKLHLENQNYTAAADAFLKAKEGDQNNESVIQARVAYAQTLMATKKWLMADLLLSELIQEKKQGTSSQDHLYPIDLFVNLAEVKQQLGNLKAALKPIQDIFPHLPPEIVDGQTLTLDHPDGIRRLERDYRDTIRPLALACFKQAEIFRSLRQYPQAKQAFGKARKLFHMVPWREDRELQELSREEFLNFRDVKILQCRWEELKTDAQEVMYSSLGDFHKDFHQAKRDSLDLDPDEIRESLSQALAHIADGRTGYQEVINRLASFYQSEFEQLPEQQEMARVKKERDLERHLKSKEAHHYDALTRIRETILRLKQEQKTPSVERIATQFSKETLEDQILNEFVLSYVKHARLTQEDRASMSQELDNLANLMAIKDAPQRLQDFSDRLIQWCEENMRATGLDDLFIPVSQQARILEEVDLYRASLLSHMDSPEQYHELVAIADRYLHKTRQVPSRISQPQLVWQMIEIGAMTAAFQGDWQKTRDYNAFLLEPEQEQYFTQQDKSDYYQAELGLAHALIQLSQKTLGNLVFLHDAEKKLQLQELATEQIKKAQKILENLKQIPGNSTGPITTRIRAKRLLNAMGSA